MKMTDLVVRAVYPCWVGQRLTPDLETGFSSGLTSPQLLLHEKQKSGEPITGDEIFAWVLPDQETYQAREGDLINECIELADIQFYETYPHLIPSEWKGKRVYAWKSVVLGDFDCRFAPYLDCGFVKPRVDWYLLDFDWFDFGPACVQE